MLKLRGLIEGSYPESRFGGFTDVDGTIAFYTRVRALMKPSDIVLDLGCGRGRYLEDSVPYRREIRCLRQRVTKIVGADPSSEAASNPGIDEFVLLDSNGRLPALADASIDAVLCDWVLEHVLDPDVFLSEIRRVLRPNGLLCLRTTNVRSYFGIASRLVPERYSKKVLLRVQQNRQAQDVFRTFYRCNTIRMLRSKLQQYGFDACVYGYDSEPLALAFSKAAWWFGVLHSKLAPRALCPTIFAFACLR
jgi:ubiquinone/menaquinone biosynthesis C-methylase UbiE